jgi:hypothetical protein
MKKETRKETGHSNGVGKNQHHYPTKPDVKTGFRYSGPNVKVDIEGPDHAHY